MFSEYKKLEKIKLEWSSIGGVKTLAKVSQRGHDYDIDSYTIGSKSSSAPTLAITAGVHGLERIGTRVALSFMSHLISRVHWDSILQHHLEKMRIVFIPLVNPVGMHRFTRCNGNGVDLMRNAPIDAIQASFGVGGHRLSNILPWYRGNPPLTEDGMETEAKAVIMAVRKEIANSPCTLALDLHSGFGMVDQLWFPYAKSKEIFSGIHQVHALSTLLDEVLPHHVYRFEPQARHYTTHGDWWDYLLLGNKTANTFLPLTLEMGSWNWIRKNPLQLFSFLGPFNPVKPHRQKRAMRRHLPLFDFLMHAVSSHEKWSRSDRELNQALGIEKWYRGN